MTVNVRKAATAGTLNINCPGFTQPALTLNTFNQTIDLTQVGKRVVTNAAITGSLGTDVITAYADWIAGPLIFMWTGSPATIAASAIVEFEIYTDQGIARFGTIYGAPASPVGSFVWQWNDSGVTQQYGSVP
jgi:hypothetical protein